MVEYCNWEEVFTGKKGEKEIFVILYWYLFNMPDCQMGIVRNMKRLREMESFSDYPKSLTNPQNINQYILRMEECNLIGRINTEKKPFYLQALSFFYSDPFCIKTPKSVKEDIATHFEEYKRNVEILKKDYNLDKKVEQIHAYSSSAFEIQRDNSVVPAQKIVQDYALEPEKFLEKMQDEEKNLQTLYTLILRTFSDLCSVFSLLGEVPIFLKYNLSFPVTEENALENSISEESINGLKLEILDKKEAVKLFKLTYLSLISKYGIVEWHLGLDKTFQEKDLFGRLVKLRYLDLDVTWDDVREEGDILVSHIQEIKNRVSDQLKVYQKLEI